MLLESAQLRLNRYLWIVSSTAVSVLVLAWLGFGVRFAVRYLVAVAMVCSALYWQGRPDVISRILAPLSYGIYLIHPLVVVFLVRLVPAEQHPSVLLMLVIFISALVTLIIRRTALKQFA